MLEVFFELHDRPWPAIVKGILAGLRPRSPLHLIAAIAGIYAVIKFFIVLYRISPLHPLSKVPGPRFAAATQWFRTYHEVWPHHGGLLDELTRLHAKYGPVVRIAPNGVHFASASAYLHIYSHASKAPKDPIHYHCFNEDLSSFAFCDPALAKERREILGPFFSRRNILSMQYVVEDKICHLTHRLRAMSHDQNDPQNLTGNFVEMFSASKSCTMDILMEFCFATTFNTLRAPSLRHPLVLCSDQVLASYWVLKNFPLLNYIVMNIPDKVASTLMPKVAEAPLMIKKTLETQVDEFVKDPEGMGDGVAHEIIYHRLLGLGRFSEKRENGEFVPRAKIGRRSLCDEAQVLLFGGTDTVGNTICVGTFYILSTPGVVDKLMQELRTVWPGNPWKDTLDAEADYIDGSGKLPVGWETVDKLPYLGGVIRESLRLSHGIVSPLQRLAPAQGITVDGWTFAAGTSVASSAPFVHLDPTIFPDPHTFRPERWIGSNAAALERYLVSFSKGPRQCLGMNLAWCELYLIFTTLYRRFELELFDTTPEDLKFKEFLMPVFNGRIKVRVKPRED